jgi:purine-cytosine permease-like protein
MAPSPAAPVTVATAIGHEVPSAWADALGAASAAAEGIEDRLVDGLAVGVCDGDGVGVGVDVGLGSDVAVGAAASARAPGRNVVSNIAYAVSPGHVVWDMSR